jgi:hypothetical protein
LWHFHIYIQGTLVWFIPSITLPFPHLLSLMASTGFMFHIHTCIENMPTVFTLLFSLHLLSPSYRCPPLNMTCVTFLSFIVEVSVYSSVEFCLCILPVNTLYLSHSKLLYYSFLCFPPYPILFPSFQYVL